ncbi:hypothetical protein [Paeniglutamicibacter kerguelensis]|uniref:MFS transporter n=1 Tax=Paeniglutamicibacter kerguelensis TaxID=254788 RepID=A0ABS4XFK5_9MICC|nr:hypothetical protein [Paeniglutamicibacter kerguelensis]MBP2387230.1 hypothetical protein [Paeniglutamicibacter kerguelensis]
MEDRGLRFVRGWIGALVCTCLAVASHTIADGMTPPLAIVGLVLAVSGAVCTALASTNFSLARTTLAVVLSQGLYHAVFGLFGHQSATGHLQESGTHAGHGAHSIVLSVGQVLPPSAVAEPSLGYLMPISHLLAAVLTIAALRKGELAARSLVDSILLYVPRRILSYRAWQPLVDPRSRAVSSPMPVARLDVLLPALRRRGPPGGSAFAY